MKNNKIIGNEGEEIALKYLEKLGFKLLKKKKKPSK